MFNISMGIGMAFFLLFLCLMSMQTIQGDVPEMNLAVPPENDGDES